MSKVKQVLKCVKHPKYKGIRDPLKGGCQTCYWVYITAKRDWHV